MAKKNRGFTILELLIALSLTVVIMGLAYTFFFSNDRTLDTAEANSTLQMEAENIQKQLINIGIQTEKIIFISTSKGNEGVGTTNLVTYDKLLESDKYKIDLNNLKLKLPNDDNTYVFEKVDNRLTFIKLNKDGLEVDKKQLSENVKEFKVRPLDIQMVLNKSSSSLIGTPGLELSIVLEIKEGYAHVTYPISSIVKFRNKEDNFNKIN